jgi:hypothetical protein
MDRLWSGEVDKLLVETSSFDELLTEVASISELEREGGRELAKVKTADDFRTAAPIRERNLLIID